MRLLIQTTMIMILIGCTMKNNHIQDKNSFFIKYYTKTLAYDDTWYYYQPKYIYYTEAPSDFNISKIFKCDEPGDGVSEVYFKNNTRKSASRTQICK